jgi:hypothetical protein
MARESEKKEGVQRARSRLDVADRAVFEWLVLAVVVTWLLVVCVVI